MTHAAGVSAAPPSLRRHRGRLCSGVEGRRHGQDRFSISLCCLFYLPFVALVPRLRERKVGVFVYFQQGHVGPTRQQLTVNALTRLK